MKNYSLILAILCGCSIISLPRAHAQTRIAKEQIEDAFLQKEGGSVYGNVTAATSAIQAATLQSVSGPAYFQIFHQNDVLNLRSNVDLYLDPTAGGTAGAVIVPATKMEFPDFLGDKIRFYSHAYKIGVSPFDLDITSDLNIKFHSDTVEDLMVITGDVGDVTVKRNVLAGNLYKFAADTTGDKMVLFGTQYKMAISSQTFDFYSDRHFKWHSDTVSDAMTLNADTGKLTLKGPLSLPVYTSLPGGSVGDVIYYDHQSDNNQDGAYVYTSSGWQKM